MPLRITNRFSFDRLNELDALYAAFRGDFLPVPDAEVLWRASQEGFLFVAERISSSERELVGAAGLFPIARTRGNHESEVVEVMELAGMVVNPKILGGFGFQHLMFALRTVALARGDDRNMCVIASIVKRNVRSYDNAKASGLIDTLAPDWLTSIDRTWCPDDEPVSTLLVPPSALAAHASLITKTRDAGFLSRPDKVNGGHQRLPLHLDLKWPYDETASLESLKAGLRVDWHTKLHPIRLIGQAPNYIEFSGTPAKK